MKVEGEPIVCHSNASPKFVPKSFECDNDDLNSGGMKLEDQKEFTSILKGNMDAHHNNTAADGWVAKKRECLDLDDFNDYDDVKAFVSPLNNSCKVDLSEEDSELYMEKSIVECQLPELIVCYKENICNIVKDICIDDGTPRDKLFCGSSLDEEDVCSINPPTKDWKDESVGELKQRDMFASDDSEHSESFGSKDSPNQCDSKDLASTPEAEYDVAYFTDNDMPMTDLVTESLKPLTDNKIKPHPQSEQVCIETTCSEVPVLAHVADESFSNTRETTSESITSAEDPKNSDSANGMSYNSKVDKGNITFDFNSLASTASDGLERCDNGDLNSSAPSTSASVGCKETTSSNPLASADKSEPQCHNTSSNPKRVEYEDLPRVEYEDIRKTEVGNFDSHTVSSEVQQGVGETSFSVAPLGSLMSNSGRIGYSGSISHRSDSSTTSTRSFAFPILQTEWNSSPVRMAKPDRKHLQKHRGWRHGILCCRF
ncbi:hypothetical protein IC582_022984 [Cucumis melo]|uniref:Uncharacterized protein LOC103489197 isoform X1 n=2 Tax=Cucumis melo TaxID=3656 RepID=A0ABM3LAM7_CUCME|nr:uncharacterized protein LOC103489197 isoform X1 [Cucumis melo]XP_016900311.2 uncharacterized protein LOC103489197 isoform X1 [Cucumis melo]XP_050947078.1 uncharacterized protein LOC103489197 isoform X1 [Cucumis melo]XP_050947079.1 uncharacterized protein LOC103489197 isoform X1 [Cucumis melo]XP_050947080.1 uncharacterized protein LOC103489197 isoform X1 [Cucumis melo]